MTSNSKAKDKQVQRITEIREQPLNNCPEGFEKSICTIDIGEDPKRLKGIPTQIYNISSIICIGRKKIVYLEWTVPLLRKSAETSDQHFHFLGLSCENDGPKKELLSKQSRQELNMISQPVDTILP